MNLSLPCSGCRSQKELYEKGEYHTVMTPWEIEFKGLKLQVRKKDKNTTRSRSNKTSNLLSNLSISFEDDGSVSKEAVFKGSNQFVEDK